MKIDAHYYTVLAFARMVGYKKEIAHQIAYASQFVDDAKINQMSLSKNNDSSLLDIFEEYTPPFFNMATCHSYFQINTFNYSAMINNTAAFHFVPGCDGKNFAKKMRCKEESPIIMDILNKAKEDNDPIKLGIVLHSYADTFTHQGFSGIISKVNDIRDQHSINRVVDNIFDIIKISFTNNMSEDQSDHVPAYGHAQAYQYPDIPYLKWEYAYDNTDDFSNTYKLVRIDNPARYTRAFKMIKEHLEEYLEKHPGFRDRNVPYEDFGAVFELLVARIKTEERIGALRDLMLAENLLDESDYKIADYDEELWLKEAFEDFDYRYHSRSIDNVILGDEFMESNWYKYYQNVKWYKEQFFTSADEHGLIIAR